MSEDHCDNRVGTRTQETKKGARKKLVIQKGLIRYEGWKTEKEGAAERDREEPEWTILGD